MRIEGDLGVGGLGWHGTGGWLDTRGRLATTAGYRGSATEAEGSRQTSCGTGQPVASISAAQSLREGTMSKAGAVVGYI